MRTSQLSGANSLIFRAYPPYTRTWYPIWAREVQQRLRLCSIAIIIILARYMHCIVSIMPVFLLTLMPSMVVGTGVHECTGWSSPRAKSWRIVTASLLSATSLGGEYTILVQILLLLVAFCSGSVPSRSPLLALHTSVYRVVVYYFIELSKNSEWALDENSWLFIYWTAGGGDEMKTNNSCTTFLMYLVSGTAWDTTSTCLVVLSPSFVCLLMTTTTTVLLVVLLPLSWSCSAAQH